MLTSTARAIARRTGMPRDVLILTANAFFVAVGFGVLMPVLPVVARQFGVSTFLASWVISSFALMRLAISPFSGTIVDRWGERVTLAVGIGTVAVTSVLAGLADTFWGLVVFRALGGLGSALFTVAALTLLLRSAPPSIRGRASGFYQGGFLVGSMAGPALGGLLALISLRAPFFFYAGTLAVGGTICLLYLRPKQAAAAASSTKPVAQLSDVMRDVRFQAACFSSFSSGFGALAVRATFVPILVTETLRLTPEWTGYLFAVSAVAQTLLLAPTGRWTDTIGRRPVLVSSLLLSALAVVVAPYAPNVWVLAAIMILTGVAGAGLGPAQSATVGDVVAGRGGTPIALYSMSMDVGVIIGPLVCGLLADHYGLPSAFWLGAAVLLASGLFAMRMPPGIPTRDDVS